MVRKIIRIDEEKCNGCGACAKACHEGAIAMVGGKAKLVREDYCDGLGDCLPGCPTGAITFEEREAPAYNQAAVEASKKAAARPHTGGCPGSMIRSMAAPREEEDASVPGGAGPSQLRNWPVQIKLASVQAPYFQGADLLIAADCTAYTYAGFHREFMKGKITLIGCPKLDAVDYAPKLTDLFAANDITSITVTRMVVPCCGGLEQAVQRAIQASGKDIPCKVVTFSLDGKILED